MTTEPVPDGVTAARGAQRAVFLSYASEDAPAAQSICTALRAAGIEVWFDQSELRGGDSWDAMIRRQIKSCALFIPIISNQSHSRVEGYFRLEWKLAIDRSHLIASDQAFLLPVVIDDTPESDDRIPERFRDVQWTRLPAGEVPAEFAERVTRLLSPAAIAAAAPAISGARSAATPAATQAPRRAAGTGGSRPAIILATVLGLAAIVGIGWATWRHLSRPVAVVPYSIEDRRMTFAVLPFAAPAGDAHAQQVAKATNEAVSSFLESHPLFNHVAPRGSVEEASARLTSPKALAKALDVHFLIRGQVEKAATGNTVKLLLVDGSNERVLGTRNIDIPPDALVPRYLDNIGDPLRGIVLLGMEAEVKRESRTPLDQLDVRALSFRALSTWRAHRGQEAKQGYTSATELLTRALALAPDDPSATYLTADINLCDCVMAWSHNPDEQKAIGTAAMERYLLMDPNDAEMLVDKAEIYQLRGHYDDALIVTDGLLSRDPDSADALATKAVSLLRLGRASEAIPIVDGLVARYPSVWPEMSALAANVHFALGDYAEAARLGQNAAALLDASELRNPVVGPVRLTVAAAEGHLGNSERSKAAMADFNASVPGVTTIADIKKWMHPTADLYGFEPLFAGLRLAGIKD